MKPAKTLFATAALALSLAAPGASAARAAGIEVLNEGFGNVGALPGWAQVNDSVPAGTSWFQGNQAVFAAQSGAPGSYAAANFLSAVNGSGSVDNWLITPVLDLSATTTLSFYTRHDALPGFDDLLEVRFASGTGTGAADFTTLLTTIGGTAGYPTDWQQYTATLTNSGSGRFAFRYLGPADTLNYVGLDTVSVITAVPEPADWMLLALGLGILPLMRRQARP
jgi:hypothetical protein